MSARILPVYLLIFLLVAITGCDRYAKKKRVTSLEKAMTSYEVALRWAQYQAAYDYHVSPDGTRPAEDLERLTEVSVTGVKQTQKILNADHTEAKVKYIISYYIKTQGTVKELKPEYKWWVNQDTGQWFIDSEFPAFF